MSAMNRLYSPWVGLWMVVGVYLVSAVSMTACTCPGPVDPPTDKPGIPDKVEVISPADKSVFNAEGDIDKAIPGIQIAVEIKITADKTGKLPDGLTARLLVNNKVAEEVKVGATTVKFSKVTLDEGTNSIQAVLELKLADNTIKTVNSNAIQVTADSRCYQIQFTKPANNAVMGGTDDVDPQQPGFQADVEIQVDPTALEEVELEVKDAAGQSTKVKAKPFGGKVSFPKITLPAGIVTLSAKIQDPAGNACSDQIKVDVRTQSPTVTITSPTSGQQFCPKDDADPQTKDFQILVKATTTAEDGSTATLWQDDKQVGTEVTVSASSASFSVTLPEQFTVKGNVQVRVKDKFGNQGQSNVHPYSAVLSGYGLTFANLLDGQTLPNTRDEDKVAANFQFTVQLTTSAPDGTEVTVDVDGSAQKFKVTGAIAKGQITLKEGKNCLTATVLEPACSTQTQVKLCVSVEPFGVPTLSCSLSKGPAFDAKGEAALNSSDDTDANKNGIQNGIKCQTDAEKDQDLELTFNGSVKTVKLQAGTGGLQEGLFDALDFQEGTNTIVLKVTNLAQKSVTKNYTVFVDTTAPQSISDLNGSIANHRKSSVALTWTAPSDGTTGSGVTQYEIRWTSEQATISESEWDKPEGKQMLASAKKAGEQVSVEISNLSIGKPYVFAVRAKDGGGNLSGISNLFKVTIDLKATQSEETGSGKTSYGFSVAAVGDLDKDGLQDVVVCAPSFGTSTQARTGAAFIYYGRNVAQGGFFSTTPDVTIVGTNASDAFCQQVEPLGDINGDGYADFAVRSFFAQSTAGRVWIFFGGPRGTLKNDTALAQARVLITGQTGLLFAIAMKAVGVNTPDLNGDNKADLLISAVSATETGSTYKGKIYVFYSRASYPTTGQPALKLELTDADMEIVNDTVGNNGTPLFGGVLAAGDINNDKNVDLLIASTADNSVIGLLGPIKPTTGKQLFLSKFTSQFSIKGTTDDNKTFGSSMAVAGDVDKDGVQEVLLSSVSTTIGARPNAGKTWLFSGKVLTSGASLTAANASVSWDGNGLFLDRVSPAGDMNNDGYADFLIGEGAITDPADANKSRSGAVYLFFGKPLNQFQSGDPGKLADVKWYGSRANANLAINGLLGGFDLTGDGFPDILMLETPPTNSTVLGRILLQY